MIGGAAALSLSATRCVVAEATTAAPLQDQPFSRAEATAIIADARKIVTLGGVERLEKLQMEGLINGRRFAEPTSATRCSC